MFVINKNCFCGSFLYKKHSIEQAEIKQRLLSQVFIEHKGNRVAVGSGFSKEQRKFYKEHPGELIGKTITVQYFEETINNEGFSSLRYLLHYCKSCLFFFH